MLQYVGADPGRGRGEGVGMLGLAVDGQQPRIAADAADDDLALGQRDPEVEVREPSGQLADLPGPPRQAGEAVQVGSRSPAPQSSKACSTASSIVCLGPLNQCLAEACHQMARSSNAPRVTIGA